MQKHRHSNVCRQVKTWIKLFTKWFNRKFKIKNMEIDHKKIIIDWKKTKCVICNFPLIINAKGSNFPAYEMSYTDFYMRYEHKFLRNIFSKEELETSKELKSLESYMGFLIDF